VYLKNYKNKKGRSVSLFRLGYDELKNAIHLLEELIQFILQHLNDIPNTFQRQAKRILKSV